MFVTGAGSVHSQRWVSFFADRGAAVTWVSLGEPPTRAYANLRFIELPKHRIRSLRPVRYVQLLRKLIREVAPDVLHAHQVWIDGIVAAAAGFRPLVVTPWGSDVLLGPRSPLKRPLISWALKRAQLVTCDGQNTARAVVELGVPRDSIELVCFGTNVEYFTPERSGAEVRSRLDVWSRPVVLSLRHLSPLYDVGTLVSAVPTVLDSCPDAVFVIAGNGTQREELIRLAEDLGVRDAVRFVGLIAEAELPTYLTAADVYVSTALSDSGLSASTAEAMACGLPVVVTDTGSNRDWIDDGVNGYIVPVQDSSFLSRKIVDLLRDPARRKAWGKMNRTIIVQRNNYVTEMARMESLYACLTKRAPSSDP